MAIKLECKSGFRSHLFVSLSGFGSLGVLLSLYAIGSSYYSVSGYGDWALPSHELVVWLCLLNMIVMVIAAGGFFLPRIRCVSVAILIGAGVMVTLTIASLKSADRIRIQGFERLSHEAAPLVEAIHAYQQTNGLPPESLDDLKVNYPAGHTIKGDDLPEFQYVPGDRAKERYHGNPWVLILETPTGSMKWDRFVYYPLQNYPPLASGGWFEKVGDWGYLHE